VKKPWVVGGKTTKYFAISHVVGWVLANIQTIWIVWLMSKYKKEIINEIRRRH
jgi:hypothetical protein